MNDDSQIPLLNDLIYRGRFSRHLDENTSALEQHSDLELEIESDDSARNNKLIFNEEEIRMILVKHMDHAYAEIIQLLEKKQD